MPYISISEYYDAPKGCMYGNEGDIDTSGLKDLHLIKITDKELDEVKECALERLEEVLSGLIEKYK